MNEDYNNSTSKDGNARHETISLVDQANSLDLSLYWRLGHPWLLSGCCLFDFSCGL